jgi:hypothetical protein
MQMNWRLTSAVLFLALYGGAAAIARKSQESTPATLRTEVSTDDVECDLNWNLSKSAVVVSPNGVRASVELRAKTVLGRTPENNRCVTDWIVHIQRGGETRTIVAGTREDQWDSEHHFEIIGWSGNGKLLLLSMISAAGDWDETTPVVYDLNADRVWRTDLALLFKNVAPKGCLLYFRPRGFTGSGEVLVDVGPLGADDLAPGEKPCFEESRWIFYYARENVARAPIGSFAEKFGTLLGKQ